jgi:hypothetical protein
LEGHGAALGQREAQGLLCRGRGDDGRHQFGYEIESFYIHILILYYSSFRFI